MAEKIRLKVKCHACGNVMEGTAKYGKGHYVPEGLDFEFIATGKIVEKSGQTRVKGEVTVVCPNCEVKNRYEI
ncbi:MAG: hypothetical protein NZM25_11945 [Leptospiraceae bacterium]|nr:hypothetical protein [Leptospiraceae bacterium]MDW8307704.1 hypothetical protein [Leptospiraceae bacterium]